MYKLKCETSEDNLNIIVKGCIRPIKAVQPITFDLTNMTPEQREVFINVLHEVVEELRQEKLNEVYGTKDE